MLEKFWFVTITGSLYRASIEKGKAVAEKIALKPGQQSRLKVGEKLQGGNLLGVMDISRGFDGSRAVMISYTASNDDPPFDPPESGNATSLRGFTHPIVGLFCTKGAATKCFNSEDQTPWDLRFRPESLRVAKRIGNRHLCFVISPAVCTFLYCHTSG